MKATQRKPGRALRGAHYTKGIRVRLTPELDKVLRRMKKLFGMPMGAAIRTGLERALADTVPDAIAIIDDPDENEAAKLVMHEYLQLIREAALSRCAPEVAEALREERRKQLAKRARYAASFPRPGRRRNRL